MNQEIPKNPFLFGLFATKPYRKWAIPALIAVLIATALSRYLVVVLSNLTDAIVTKSIDMPTVWFWAITYFFLYFIAENIVWRSSGFTGMRWFTNFSRYAYSSLYKYLTLHSRNYFNNRFAGALMNKMANAVEGSVKMFNDMLWGYIPSFLGLLLYIIFVWIKNPLLGLIMVVWSIIFIGLNFRFAKKLKPFSVKNAEESSILRGRIVDSLSNISLVHEHAYITGEHLYIQKFIKKYHDAGLTVWLLSEWILVANGVMLSLFIGIMIGTSLYLFQQQLISVGVIIMIIAIATRLTESLFFLGQKMKETARDYGQAREGLEEILQEHIIVDAPDAAHYTFTKGDVMIDTIDFEYENNKVFSNFSVYIPAGQKVGLVGRSGAGKTTFVSLLLRHFDIQKGDITIDGESIYDVKLESLRQGIAFVPQDTSLFHRSIRENIRYSNPEATDAEVQKAARLAHADRFIGTLSQGYDTLVGERGVKLSGGQRQRIAIARAFLKKAPILILDEATSSLDSESEHAIQLSLEELMKNKTVIAIAHRLSTLKKMDRIIVIDNGKIVEDGTPDKLMKQNGIFKKLWDHQVKGFIVDE